MSAQIRTRTMGWRVTVYGHAPDRCEIDLLDTVLCRSIPEVCDILRAEGRWMQLVVIVPELVEGPCVENVSTAGRS